VTADELDEDKRLEEVLRMAVKAAEQTGELLRNRSGDRSRTMKHTHGDAIDYATDTDMAAEALLRELLAPSGYNFHGEEGAGDDFTQGWCWVVDPIDGTLNWANGLPMCAVSIGLCFNGDPVLGVIHTPYLVGRTWVGVVGRGAWCDGEPVFVNDVDPDEAVVAYDGVRGTGQDPYLVAIRSVVGRHRLIGSTATELALCAGGGFAAVIAPVAMFWDVAAGVALVRAAGGVALSLDGSPAMPGSGSVVAGSARTVKAVTEALRNLSAD
jgi:myo-inositol-1(or 4)-monophosphatase